MIEFLTILGIFSGIVYIQSRICPIKSPLIENQGKLESQWRQLITHSLNSCFSAYILYEHGWLSSNGVYFQDRILAPVILPAAPILFSMYHLQCITWIYELYMTTFVLEKQKDYFILMAHHVITLSLLFLSHYTQLQEIGIAVLFLHDVSDIFIDFAKIFNYMQWETYETYYLSYVGLISLVISWVFFRVILFGNLLFYQLIPIVHLSDTIIIENDFLNLFFFEISNVFFKFCYIEIGLLCALSFMHAIWSIMICRLAYRIFFERTPSKIVYQEYE